MKKIVLGTALLAAVSCGASAHFSGGYGELDVGYVSTSGKIAKTSNKPKVSYNQSGFGLFGKVGGGCNHSGVYVGGEFQFGRAFSKKEYKSSPKSNLARQWNVGAAVRVGGHLDNDVLLYGRLGIEGDTYSFLRQGAKDRGTVLTYSLVPGVGANMMITHNMYVSAEVDYGVSFKRTSPAASKASNFNSTRATIGIGYKF